MVHANYYREYSKRRYQEQKDENEIYFFIRHMFQPTRDRSHEAAAARRRRHDDPDRIISAIHLILDDSETRRIRQCTANRTFRAKHRYDSYYESDPLPCIRHLFA